VSVAYLGASVEMNAHALEVFIAPDNGLELQCPACSNQFDPSGPRTIPPLRRV